MAVNSIWVNVDRPHKEFKMHRDDCAWLRLNETPFKKIGRIGKDGGWFQFKSKEEARDHHANEFSQYKFWPCQFCFKGEK